MSRALRLIPITGLLAWCALFWSVSARDPFVSQPSTHSYRAAEQVGRWLGRVASGEAGALAKKSRRAAWDVQSDQPATPKWIMGIGWALFHRLMGGWSAMVLALFVVGIGGVIIVSRITGGAFGREAGWLAGALLLGSPGFAASLSTVGPEAVIGMLWALLALAVLRARTSRAWRIATIVVFGLAVAAHHQTLWLWPGLALAAWWSEREPGAREDALRAGMVHGIRLPWHVLVLPVTGFAMLWALWPWVPIRGAKALERFLIEPFRAAHPAYAFRGELFVQATGQAPPWNAAVDAIVDRLPLVLILGLTLGLATAILRGLFGSDARWRQALVPLSLLIGSVIVSGFNGSPYYDHLRLDLALLPLVAVIAAPGLAALGQAAAGWIRAAPWGRRVAWGLPLALAALVWVECLMILPQDALYRNALAGPIYDGEQGTTLLTETGLHRSWLADWAAVAPEPCPIAVAPRPSGNDQVLRRVQAEGWLPKTLQPASPKDARCLGLVHMPEIEDKREMRRWIVGKAERLRIELHGRAVFKVVCTPTVAQVEVE
jgi:hypothetical protein